MLTLTSRAFSPGGEIPRQYTCDGLDLSPPLFWSGLPGETCSLALIIDDPDSPDPGAPGTPWVHWVLYNIPPHAAGLPEGMTSTTLPEGTCKGLNDWGRTGYGGPCPRVGRHRYSHRLYALDTVLPELDPATKANLERAMGGHVLARAELVGTYRRTR